MSTCTTPKGICSWATYSSGRSRKTHSLPACFLRWHLWACCCRWGSSPGPVNFRRTACLRSDRKTRPFRSCWSTSAACFSSSRSRCNSAFHAVGPLTLGDLPDWVPFGCSSCSSGSMEVHSASALTVFGYSRSLISPAQFWFSYSSYSSLLLLVSSKGKLGQTESWKQRCSLSGCWSSLASSCRPRRRVCRSTDRIRCGKGARSTACFWEANSLPSVSMSDASRHFFSLTAAKNSAKASDGS